MPSLLDTTTHKDRTGLSRDGALKLARDTDLDALLDSANALRIQNFSNRIELCAIINAKSGNCNMDCRFCSQAKGSQAPIATFDLYEEEELRERLSALGRLPVTNIGIVTSGSALSGAEFERVRSIIETLPAELQGRVCGSLGRLDQEHLESLRDAGISRYHHNMETSERHYAEICTTQTWESRMRTVRRALKTGIPVCSGGLFGMGETWEDRIDLAFRLRDEGVDNIPVNFLTAHSGTALGDMPKMAPEEALRIIALLRHILPAATLRICGGRPAVLGDRQRDMFRAGANALMTGDYLTTRGSALVEDLDLIAGQGLEVATP
ncbi:biotin synthase BioB [Phaeovibrio sulfidiphilus]|uniref:Biotin synthase n=1 Tax=Phaeovibrio sulfidiphilus TaxID=1220600 RepID=A0A8J6YLJ1_9PROT|nr:biotin synthase BioB [Phaeovibrio sulfidiphilus]MBE1236985.1 biotin synthase BioB [Phaeovibrio sulfidiphilus]